jgi:hypothetical protein
VAGGCVADTDDRPDVVIDLVEQPRFGPAGEVEKEHRRSAVAGLVAAPQHASGAGAEKVDDAYVV